jgi:hypothetical protein
LFCDEAFAQNNLQHDATLKSLITEASITIEPKGFGLFQTKNYLHLMLAANAEWFVPATHDERRYFVLDVSDSKRSDAEYFAKLCNQMENGGCAAMLHDLLEMPASVGSGLAGVCVAILSKNVHEAHYCSAPGGCYGCTRVERFRPAEFSAPVPDRSCPGS